MIKGQVYIKHICHVLEHDVTYKNMKTNRINKGKIIQINTTGIKVLDNRNIVRRVLFEQIECIL